jgi:hypothetical protein
MSLDRGKIQGNGCPGLFLRNMEREKRVPSFARYSRYIEAEGHYGIP